MTTRTVPFSQVSTAGDMAAYLRAVVPSTPLRGFDTLHIVAEPKMAVKSIEFVRMPETKETPNPPAKKAPAKRKAKK